MGTPDGFLKVRKELMCGLVLMNALSSWQRFRQAATVYFPRHSAGSTPQ